jgi:hypothetical protein
VAENATASISESKAATLEGAWSLVLRHKMTAEASFFPVHELIIEEALEKEKVRQKGGYGG